MDHQSSQLLNPNGAWPHRWRDIAVVMALTAVVITIAATAPSNTYAYAQLQQIGAVVGTIEQGEWLLPRDQMGGLARKPQLYAWLDAPILMATGIYNDFTFRLPTVAATFAAAVLVYLLGRRWYGRRTGLLAACLWVTILDMRNLAYIAVTDMLLSLWVLGSIMCADKLLFHPAPRDRRRWWAVGLWATMILGAMTKGWGVLNVILVGGALGLAVALRPGFKALRRPDGTGRKLALLVRLLGRRWWRAMKAVRFGWGMLAMAVVLAPICAGMFAIGGEEFREIVKYEFVARVTGGGEHTPHSSSVPAVGQLFYYGMPASGLMVLGILLAGLRGLVGRRSPILIPLCWVVAVALPFSLTHGFRPDYLLPCYAATALMGAWAVGEVIRRGRGGGVIVGLARHAIAAGPVVIGVLLMIVPAIYLFHEYLPAAVTKNFRMPAVMPSWTWRILAGLIPLGAAAAVLAVRWSLQWRLRRVAALTLLTMLGVIFVDKNVISRHARTRDGEKMIAFAEKVSPVIGDDAFAVQRMHKLATELYLGRFGDPTNSIAKLNRSPAKWLLTCDTGLIELGAREVVYPNWKSAEIVKPDWLGEVEVQSEVVISQDWGHMYLIRLKDRPIRGKFKPREVGHKSGRRDDW